MGSGLWAEIDSNERSGSVPIYPKTHLQLSSQAQEVNKLGLTQLRLMIPFLRVNLRQKKGLGPRVIELNC